MDTISTVLIIYDGVQGTVLLTGGATQTLTLDGVGGLPAHTFTVDFNVDGTATVSDVVSNTEVGVFTADGFTTLEYQWAAGQDFKIGGFGATTVEAAATSLEFNLQLTDGDGDTVVIDDGLHIRLSPDYHDLQTGTDGVDDVLAVGVTTGGTLVGLGGNDTLTGNTGDDILAGGPGNDTINLISGGNDTIIWGPNDAGGTDTIQGFSNTNVSTTNTGDVLDLADLLVGEHANPGDLSNYLTFSYDGANTTITADVDGVAGGSIQSIVLQGVDLTAGNTLDTSTIINNLLVDGNLVTDA